MAFEWAWIWTILSISGAILNAKLNKNGFILYIIANIGWIITDIEYKLYAQIPVWVIFIVIGVYGYIDWSKKEAIENELS